MKDVDLYLKVRHAVRIEGLSERAAARCAGVRTHVSRQRATTLARSTQQKSSNDKIWQEVPSGATNLSHVTLAKTIEANPHAPH